MRNLVFSLSALGTAGHGSLVTPRPRNSVDYLVGVNEQSCANLTGGNCTNGQAAFWYSQGCTIGCQECDHVSGRRQTDVCGLGTAATVNNPSERSLNRAAAAGSPEDIYKHNPWRAPGLAPVADACGLAGGTPWGADAPEEGVYINTTYAHHGMRGSTLLPMPTGAVWQIGGTATVSWNIRNNHGGGYSYRLCPSSEPLTEACFQAHPLRFVRDAHSLVFANGTRVKISGWLSGRIECELTSQGCASDAPLADPPCTRRVPRLSASLSPKARARSAQSGRCCRVRAHMLFTGRERPATASPPLSTLSRLHRLATRPHLSAHPPRKAAAPAQSGCLLRLSFCATVPEAGLGPRCLPGPDDTWLTPYGCEAWEGRSNNSGHVPGPCVRCPETAGSDCSRCDNGYDDEGRPAPAFAPPLPGVVGSPIHGVVDVLQVRLTGASPRPRAPSAAAPLHLSTICRFSCRSRRRCPTTSPQASTCSDGATTARRRRRFGQIVPMSRW